MTALREDEPALLALAEAASAASWFMCERFSVVPRPKGMRASRRNSASSFEAVRAASSRSARSASNDVSSSSLRSVPWRVRTRLTESGYWLAIRAESSGDFVVMVTWIRSELGSLVTVSMPSSVLIARCICVVSSPSASPISARNSGSLSRSRARITASADDRERFRRTALLTRTSLRLLTSAWLVPTSSISCTCTCADEL